MHLFQTMTPSPSQVTYDVDKARWYVACTSPRHEKTAAAYLAHRGVEHFLPLYERRSRWKDRVANVITPLFPGYVFLHLAYRERLQALQAPGITSFIQFGGVPAPVDSQEIETLRAGLSASGVAEPCAYLAVGNRVRVLNGPFTGLTGILQKKDGVRLVVSVHEIMRSVMLEIDGADLEPCN
jgi:transcription antitermination factor NusG